MLVAVTCRQMSQVQSLIASEGYIYGTSSSPGSPVPHPANYRQQQQQQQQQQQPRTGWFNAGALRSEQEHSVDAAWQRAPSATFKQLRISAASPTFNSSSTKSSPGVAGRSNPASPKQLLQQQSKSMVGLLDASVAGIAAHLQVGGCRIVLQCELIITVSVRIDFNLHEVQVYGFAHCTQSTLITHALSCTMTHATSSHIHRQSPSTLPAAAPPFISNEIKS